MPAIVNKLGPGTVTIGETGTEVDFSCQVTAAHVDWTEDAEDSVTVLCGESVPGSRSYEAAFAGTVLQDLGATPGLVEYTWSHKGEQVPFVFVPSTAAGKQVSGQVILTPLRVGGEEAGANMDSDFEWPIVGDPVLEAVALGATAAGEEPAEDLGADAI